MWVLLVKFDLERPFLPTYGHRLSGVLAVIRQWRRHAVD
jgi:hypothetical protein